MIPHNPCSIPRKDILFLFLTPYKITHGSATEYNTIWLFFGGAVADLEVTLIWNIHIISTMSKEAFVKILKKYIEILKTIMGNYPTLCPPTSGTGWVIWFLVWNSDHKQLIRYLEVQDCILTSPNTLAPWEVSFATLSSQMYHQKTLEKNVLITPYE